MKNKIASMCLLITSAVFLIVLATPRKAPAKNGCSNPSLQGSYGIQAIGTNVSGQFQGPVAFVGILTFDGAGQLAGNLTLRLNTASGPITQVKVPYTGTYTVNADCTVEDIWVNQLTGGSNTHESILVDNGRQLLILVTTAGAPPVVSAVGSKLFHGDSDQE